MGLTELAAVVDGCASAVNDHVSVEANLRIARGLDYYTGTVLEVFMEGYERLKSVAGGGRYDALASDGRTTYPGVGISFGVSRTLIPLFADGALEPGPKVPSTVLVALVDEESRGASERVAAALRSRGIATEVAASAQKFGKQIRYAERRGIPYVWFPGQQRGQGHPQRRPGRRRPRTAGPPTPEETETVIRTHDAGACAPSDAGQTVTLAGWVASRRDHGGVAFIDLREASGVVQVVVRDEAVAHQLRSEYCLKVTGEVDPAHGGQREPQPPDGRDRGRRRPSRGAQRRRPAAVPDRRPHRGRRGGRGSSTATSTCAVRRPTTRSGCAARSTRRPATSSTTTASSRSRRRR